RTVDHVVLAARPLLELCGQGSRLPALRLARPLPGGPDAPARRRTGGVARRGCALGAPRQGAAARLRLRRPGRRAPPRAGGPLEPACPARRLRAPARSLAQACAGDVAGL